MSEPRFLRPAHLRLVGGRLWAVDVLQPVAAVLDPDSGAVRRLASWPQLPAATEHQWRGEWRALSDGSGLWVQAGHGPVARVTEDGDVTVATVRTTTDTSHYRLAAAGPSGAWLAGPRPVQDIDSSPDTPPPDHGWARLLTAGPDGTVRPVRVEHPVLDLVGTDEGVALAVDTGGGHRRDLGAGNWAWEPDPVWLLVPWWEPVPARISAATHAAVDGPEVPASRVPGHVFLWHPATTPANPAESERRSGEPSGELVWRFGWDRSVRSYERVSIATGHDPVTGSERRRVGLGPGTVRAVLGTPEALFAAVARPRHGQPVESSAAAVLRLDPATGAVEELLPLDAVDISGLARPLGTPPADADSYARYWLRYWADEDGAVRPVTARMSAGRARLVGEWPRTAVDITFDWAPLPGWRLRRRLPLFDELGRPTPPEYSDVQLMEDLETGHVPPVPPGATGGELNV